MRIFFNKISGKRTKKYPLLMMITCRPCNITFENRQTDKNYTYCPICGKIKDTRDRSESNKKRAEIRKNSGLCTYCGNERAEENRTRCMDCINIRETADK